ncbi:esterase/lipase family protein [Streptomyces sp. NPDC050355]|uniref:esterase/lipase family protein n=1 Tax=Streptomyces sp. NPDC050355 TaxID=3365609 RepID=UPI0037926876
MARERVDDLVVVLPGILGSRLLDADGKEVWGPSGGAVWRAIHTFGRSVKALTLPSDLGDGPPGDGVRAHGVMPTLHALPGVGPVVDGYTGLLDWLERLFTLRRRRPGEGDDVPANLLAFAYDWRLSCRYNAERLKERVERALSQWRDSAPQRRAARVVFLCHSMGGLVTRYYVECLGGFEITRRVVTLGTPHRGSLSALVHLVDGLRVGWGPWAVQLTDFARSLPSLHQITPDYACLVRPGGLRYPRETAGLMGVDEKLLRDAGAFHAEIRRAAAARPGAAAALLPVVGVRQPTPTTADIVGDRLRPQDTIDGLDEGGDGRVPRLSAAPPGTPTGYTPCEQHGSLQNGSGVRDALWGWLAAEPPYHRTPLHDPVPLGVHAPELLPAGAPYDLTVTVPPEVPGGDELAISATLHPVESGRPLRHTLANRGGGRYATSFSAPAPGPYRVAVAVAGRRDSSVTALLLVGEGDG